jgi:hypothetical protein
MTYDGRRHEYLYRFDILSHPSIYLVHGITVKRQLCILIICSSARDSASAPRLIPSTNLELRHPALRGLLRC